MDALFPARSFLRNLFSKKKELLRIANNARDAKDWATAAANYRRVLETNPGLFGVWVQLGHSEKEIKNFDAALVAYKEAERINKKDIDLKVQLGHFLKDNGKYEDALAYYRSAVDAGSDDVHALQYIEAAQSGALQTASPAAQTQRAQADAARDIGDLPLAARLYQEVILIDGDDAASFVQLGNCLKDLGRIAPAEKAYTRALELRPDDADCYLQLGHLMKQANRPDRALAYYVQSEALDPTRPDASREIEHLRIVEAPTPNAPQLPSPLAAFKKPNLDISERASVILGRYQYALAQRRH